MKVSMGSAACVLLGSLVLVLPDDPIPVWSLVALVVLVGLVTLALSARVWVAVGLATVALGVPVALAFLLHGDAERSAGVPGQLENCDPSCGVSTVGLLVLAAPFGLVVTMVIGLARELVAGRRDGPAGGIGLRRGTRGLRPPAR